MSQRLVTLATDAPAHWPTVRVAKTALSDWPKLAEAVVTQVVTGLEATCDDVRLAEPPVVRMLPSGFFVATFLVVEGSVPTTVVVYDEVSPDAVRQFGQVRRDLEAVGERAVFFAPESIRASRSSAALEPFDLSLFQAKEDKDAEGVFAAWSSKDGESFRRTKTYKHMVRAYKALDGFEPWYFMTVANSLGLAGATQIKAPLGLPEEPIQVAFTGPDCTTVFLVASKEKGILFALPIEATPEWSESFWRLYADSVEVLRAHLEKRGMKPFAEYRGRAIGWLRFAAQCCDELEGSGGRAFGMVENTPNPRVRKVRSGSRKRT